MTRQLLTAALLIACNLAAVPAVAVAQEIYVPNYDDDTVSVHNATTLSTLVTIPIVGGRPSGVAFTADHKFAFVTLGDSNLVAVINTASRTVVKYIETISMAFDSLIALRPQGDRMYVTSCSDPKVGIIDVATQTAIGEIDLEDGGYQMAFSPDGTRGYIGSGYTAEIACSSNQPQEGLHVVDLDSSSPTVHTQIGFIETSQELWGVAVAPGGSYALGTGINVDTSASRIVKVDLVAGVEDGAVMCGGVPCEYSGSAGVVFNARGTRAFVVDAGTNELIVVDTDPASATFLQQLSSAPIVLSVANAAWQLRVSNGCAHVIAFDFTHSDPGPQPSELVTFNVAGTDPVQVVSGVAGSFGYELDVWGRAKCPLPTGSEDGDGSAVHGAGRLAADDKVTFEFDAKRQKKGGLRGHCRVVEYGATRETVRCLSVTGLTVVGSVATITGAALHNGVASRYEITVVDNGAPGKNGDTFHLTTTDTGLSVGGVLGAGNVKIKMK